MKIVFILLFIGISVSAQNDTIANTTSKPFKGVTAENAFKASVANNSVRLYIIGGIVSAVREKELEFAKKYQISFHDFGCVVPANLSFYDKYNQFAFAYLTEKFGESWIKDINPNVVGIKKYKDRF